MNRVIATFIALLLAAPAWAGAGKIKKGATANIVLPSGESCEGKVVQLAPDAFTVKLIHPTSVCGNRDDVIQIRQARVQAILREKRSKSHPALREIAAIGIFAGSFFGAVAIGYGSQHIGAFFGVLAPGAVFSAWLRGGKTLYTVLVDGLD